MKAGELFIDLSIKGADKAKDAVKSVGDFLSDTSSKGLLAKAAIVGAIAGLEKLSAVGGNFGNTIKNLSIYTGGSTKYIQQLREAFLEAGQDASEADSAFVQVQKTLGEAALSGQAPKGLATIFSEEGITDFKKASEDIPGTIDRIFDYVKRHAHDMPPAIRNALAESMGIGQGGVITGMKFGGDSVQKITKNILGDDRIDKLQRIHILWSDFFKKSEMFNAQIAADFGKPMIEFLDKLLASLLMVENQFKKVFDLFEAKGAKDFFHGLADDFKWLFTGSGTNYANIENKKDSGVLDKLKDSITGKTPEVFGPPTPKEYLTPNLNSRGGPHSSTNTINSNITIHGDVKDPNGIKSEIDRSHNRAIRQLSSVSQGT